jgi:NAD(P)-dependent dehydrogenase (short-subunit alcohol dehydrogenase family)
MIPTKTYAVHNATGDPLRNNSVPVGHGIEDRESIAAVAKFVGEAVSGTECTDQQRRHHEGGQRAKCCGRRLVSSIVTTNLLRPVRMTSALIEHLKQQPAAWLIHVTSGTAFVPLAVTTAYCAERVAFLRNGAGPNDAEATKQVNDWFASGAH